MNAEIWMCHSNLFALNAVHVQEASLCRQGRCFFARKVFCTKNPSPVTLQALLPQAVASRGLKTSLLDATDSHSFQLSSRDKARKRFH